MPARPRSAGCGDQGRADEHARAGQKRHSDDGRAELAEIGLVRSFEDERRKQHDEHELGVISTRSG